MPALFYSCLLCGRCLFLSLFLPWLLVFGFNFNQLINNTEWPSLCLSFFLSSSPSSSPSFLSASSFLFFTDLHRHLASLLPSSTLSHTSTHSLSSYSSSFSSHLLPPHDTP